ncbi:RNA polymerase sigma factor [Maribacter sp. 2304DJ31-5]|uniref:RNA polymerase sigma factor n=1 Tax=Maribacter sp. 2304DJ31-5 TaxID=3386273 RepID=UPI0039BD197D
MPIDINEITHHYKSKIFQTCLGYTNDIEEANDLTQEVLIRIWKGIKNFREDSSLSTWIYRITVNTCLMFHRKNKMKKISFNDVNESLLDNVQNLSYENEELEQLNDLISKLSVKDRLIIILYLQDLSYKDISDITGISINYVGVKINRIKKLLSNQMNKL